MREGTFRNIHRPCLSTVISHAYLTGVSIYCCFLRRLRKPGLRAPTEWRKTASSTMSVWVCAQKSCWLREINVLCCVERKNWWWWWSHAPVCVWGKECVLPCCMVESKHVPILWCRHALKSLKLRCSLGSNCGPNSSYFPHIDALEAKERERFWILSYDCQQGQAVYITYVDCGIQIILQALTKHLKWPISFDPLLPKLWVNAHQQGADTKPC